MLHQILTIRTGIAFIPLSLVVALLYLWPTLGKAAQLPTPPQVFIDTTYSPPSGNTITVNAGGNFQTALNNAQPGDTIVLQAGATFTGPFTLPNKAGNNWIYIRSSNYSSLPVPGNRVSPSDAANMPKLVATAAEGVVITAANAAHHYRFVGIEMKPVAGNFLYGIVNLGAGLTSLSSLPHDIVFDRVFVHGDPLVGTRRGIAMDGISVAVVDSYISDFKEDGADTQALWAYNTPGPLKIVNNLLEAAGENILTGGADPAIFNAVPSDIEIRGNHFYKPLSWMGLQWTVKNLLEFKNARRVLLTGNVFENNWQSAQSGFAILVSPRNQDGGAPWSVTRDITFQFNKLLNVASAFNIGGRDYDFQSQVSNGILIKDTLIDRANGLGGGDNRLFQITNGPVNLTIDHNTGFVGDALGFTESTPDADQFDFKNNLVERGQYGFVGTGTAEGLPTLNAQYTNWQYVANAQIGSPAYGVYPPGNYFPENASAVGFVNYAGKDYHLSASSPFNNAGTDGKDLGADIDAVNAATACAISGQCTSGGNASLAPPGNLRITQ